MEEERITGNTQWDGLGRPAIFYAMISIWCGIFLSVVDGNICNVALPVIAQELGVPSADSIWVINAFQLVVMMALLPFSTLGESCTATRRSIFREWRCSRRHRLSAPFPTVC